MRRKLAIDKYLKLLESVELILYILLDLNIDRLKGRLVVANVSAGRPWRTLASGAYHDKLAFILAGSYPVTGA